MSSVRLNSHQRWLVDTLTTRPSSLRVVVVGETGTGKTTALINALRAMADASGGIQALFVSPSRAAAQNILARVGDLGLGVRLVDKKSLRSTARPDDLRESSAPTVTAVVAADLRDDWSRRFVESTRWDVIVVDEAARFPWIREWLIQSSAPRIIVVQSTALPPAWGFSSWESAHFAPWTERRVLYRTVPFEISGEEAELDTLVTRAMELGAEKPTWGATLLGRAAQSSPFALQAAALGLLDRLRPLRNALMHGSAGPEDAAAAARANDLQGLAEYYGHLERIVDAVDRLPSDSRFDAFYGLVLERTPKLSGSYVVFTREARTADYLVDRLGFLREHTLLVRPGSDHESYDPVERLALVVSDNALEGLDLGRISVGVYYDEPLRRRGARESRLSREAELTIFVLERRDR